MDESNLVCAMDPRVLIPLMLIASPVSKILHQSRYPPASPHGKCKIACKSANLGASASTARCSGLSTITNLMLNVLGLAILERSFILMSKPGALPLRFIPVNR